ncbi:hypothetical protein ACQ1ZK_21450, partial [Enterococcus faecium]
PFLTSSVVATTVLSAAGPGGAGAGLLAALAAGERTAALLVPLGTAPGARLPGFAVDGSGRPAGQVRGIAGALEADVLLVP